MAKMAVAIGLLIFFIKLAAYLVSGSVALLSDAMESIVNIAASIMMLASIRVAMMPADADHRYGHQRAENISCLVEGILIVIAALMIIIASAERLLNPVDSFTSIGLALVISLVATSLNGGMSYLLMRSSRQNGSIALEGDAKHLMSDVISSVGIVFGLILAELTGWYILDPIMALVVALLLIRMAYTVLAKTCHDLMDHSCPESEAIIESVLKEHGGFLQYHDLKTRHVGEDIYVEMHLCVPADMTMAEAHQLTESIEDAIRVQIPSVVVSIHLETEKECVLPSEP